MSPVRIHYSEHAAQEMKKAELTRQAVRLTLAHGRKDFSDVSSYGDTRWTSTLRIENFVVQVVWVQRAGYVYVVTAYRLGDFD